MKTLLLVQKDQKIILDTFYEAICSELQDCDLRRLDSSEQTKLKFYFEDIDLAIYDRIILMLRTKKELKQLGFIRTLPNLVILEHDACQNYISNSKYKGEFSRYYNAVPWARILVSGAQVSQNFKNEGFDSHFISKGYDPKYLKNLGSERDIELGFIGSIESSVYTERQRFLIDLAEEEDLQLLRTEPGEDYAQAMNRIKFFISADIGLIENMVKNFEAMACGCILFAYDQGDLENAALGFKDMKNIVLYSNKAELLGKVDKLRSDSALCQEIAKNGQTLAEENYTWGNLAKKVAAEVKRKLRPQKKSPSNFFVRVIGDLSSLWMRQSDTVRLALLLFFAFIPRLLAYWQQPYITRDAYLYLTISQNIANGNWHEATMLAPWMPPLYPLLLAIPIYLGIDPELGAVCISMVGSLVLLFCIYSIANKIFKSRHLAELCLLLAAVNRLMVEASYAISRESLYIPLLAVAISFIVTALSSEPKQTKATRRQSLVYLGALFAGLAYATRQEGAEVLICFFLLIAICNSRHRKLFRQLLKKSVLFLLIFWAPSIVLHQFYNSDIGSKWDPLNKERSQLFIKHVLRN